MADSDPHHILHSESQASPLLRSLVRAHRDGDPTEQEVERLTLRVAPLLSPPAIGGLAAGGTTAYGAGKFLTSVAPWFAAGMVAGGVGASIATVGQDTPSPQPTKAARSQPVGAPKPRTRPAPPVAAEPARRAAPRSPLAPLPAAPIPSSVIDSDVSTPAAPGRPPTARFPESESELLMRAQKALASGDATLALSLTQRHTRFPRAVMGQERERIAIEALIRLGRQQEARARARRFAKSYPKSGYLPRVRELLR